MSIVDDGQKALEVYKKTGALPNLKELVKDSNDYGVMKCIFEKELDVWAYISIEETKEAIEHSINMYNDDVAADFPHATSTKEKAKEAVISLSAMLAQTYINLYSPYQLDAGYLKGKTKDKWKKMFRELQPKLIKLWLDAFKDVPTFVDELKDKIAKYGDHNISLDV